MEIINQNKEKLVELCERFHVTSLFVFGSVLTTKFNENSDIDFVVYFDSIPVLDYADNFFDLLHELEEVFERKIDLISGKALKNPYFIEEVEHTKQLVYGKNDNQVII